MYYISMYYNIYVILRDVALLSRVLFCFLLGVLLPVVYLLVLPSPNFNI